MSTGETSDSDDVAADLFDRWYAHHAGAPEPAPAAPPAPRAPKHAARPEDALRTAVPGDAAPVASVVGTTRTDHDDTGREIREGLGRCAVESEPVELPAETPAETPAAVQDAVPERRSRPTAALETGSSTDVEFPPRTGIRLLVGGFLLALVAATALAVYVAFDDPMTLTVGMAGTLAVLTLVVYAVRAASTPTRLAIRSGQLEIIRGSKRELYDLASRYTPVEIVSTPGHRNWQVLIGRVDREPVVIDASMVDPTLFTEAVRRHRPTPQP